MECKSEDDKVLLTAAVAKKCVVCGHDAKFLSVKYEKPFCSDICLNIEELIEERRHRK